MYKLSSLKQKIGQRSVHSDQFCTRLGYIARQPEDLKRLVGEVLPVGDGRGVVDPSLVFDLGDSGGADVARDKDAMVGEAVAVRGKPAR